MKQSWTKSGLCAAIPASRRIRRAAAIGSIGSLGFALAACSSTSATQASSATTPTSVSSTSAGSGHGSAKHRGSALVGVVTALQSSAVELKVHGKSETVLEVPATTYRQGKTTIVASALQPGERIRILLKTGATSPTAKTVIVLGTATSHTGTLSALSSTGFVLNSSSGKSTTVVTSSATIYLSGNTAASASALKNGETVHVFGKIGANGSIAASKVIVKATG